MMNITLSNLSMDRREPESIFDALVALGNPPDLVTLETGDYQFFRHSEEALTQILIERATWGNFLDKIKTGELATQLRRAIDSEALTILLIEGRISLEEGTGKLKLLGPFSPITTGFSYSSVRGFLLVVQLAGVAVVYTSGKADTAQEIVSLYKYFGSDEHEGLTKNYRPKIVSLKPPNVGEEILMSIPTVGIENARGLIKAFSSINRVAMATEKELMQVDKIGKVKAKLIREALNESYY